MSSEEINIFKVLDYIRDHAEKYAQAKANRVYVEEYRKSLKAMLMRRAAGDGVGAAVQQESLAYADPEYIQHLKALEAAVENEEKLRWMLIAAQAKAEAWRTLSANERLERRVVG
jgi:hypothetical protein